MLPCLLLQAPQAVLLLHWWPAVKLTGQPETDLPVLLGRPIISRWPVSVVCLDQLLNQVISPLHESLLHPHFPRVQPDACGMQLAHMPCLQPAQFPDGQISAMAAPPGVHTIAVIDGLWGWGPLALWRDLQVVVEYLSIDLVELIVELPDLGVTRLGASSQR